MVVKIFNDARTLLDSDYAEKLIFCKVKHFMLQTLFSSWKLDLGNFFVRV
jgi:hypothetical protein